MLQKVVRSTVIDAPIERVWAVLRDFNSHDQWHDVVDVSRIERNERSDQVGCVRSFTLKDGNRIREQLLTLDDRELQEHLLHRRSHGAAAALRGHGDAQAGDRRQPHLLALGIELRHAAGHGARAARHGGARASTKPASNACAATCAKAATCARPAARRCPPRCPCPRAAWRCAATAGPKQLEAENVDAPPPRDGEVRIRQRAIGVNFIDVYLRRGWIPPMLPVSNDAPGVPGMEAAGTVLDVGAGVSHVMPGDRVAYLGPVPGAYCSVRCVPAQLGAAPARRGRRRHRRRAAAEGPDRRLPAARPGPRAAAARGCWCTRRPAAWASWCAPGHAAWARAVIGTVSSEEKARVARAHGCEHVIVTRDYRFADAVQQACGGADVVIDGLGDAARDQNLAALARKRPLDQPGPGQRRA